MPVSRPVRGRTRFGALLLVLGLVLALALAGCGGGAGGDGNAGAGGAGGGDAASSDAGGAAGSDAGGATGDTGGGADSGGTTGAGGGREIVIVGTDMKFEPAEITVKKGEPVTFVFENKGYQEHDFTVDDMQVDIQSPGHTGENPDHAVYLHASPGQRDQATLVPTQEGEFEFYCSIPGHRAAGMSGRLVVQP
ncbi:MAG TPA: plastocyanin/azurin family copper-binding protein [Thermaerobacter sp.]